MKRNEFANLADMNLPLLGFGCMRYPTFEDGTIDQVRLEEMVDYAMAHGLNYFDTAYYYHDGKSEGALGQALKKYPRESYYITDKLPYQIWHSADPAGEMERVFEDQLKRCNTDYFDFYFFHSYQKQIYEISKQYNAYAFLKQKQKEGKIRKIGFSFHSSPDVLATILDEFEWDAAQLQLNYHDWDFIRIKECYALCEQHKVPVFVMEPVRGGNLMKLSQQLIEELETKYPGRSLASWALRWVASLPNVKVINSGMSNMEQLEDNIATLITNFQPLSEEEYGVVERMKKDFAQNTVVPCTGCRYCMDCPKGVDIPRIFSILNDAERVDIPFHGQLNYVRFVPDQNKANHCVKCGICVKKCPQHIDIPTELAAAHEKLFADISK